VDYTVAFGPFRLQLTERMLLKEEKPVRLGSRALEILIVLIERAGETVLKDQLIDRVWPDTVIGERALHVHVAALRCARRQATGGMVIALSSASRVAATASSHR